MAEATSPRIGPVFCSARRAQARVRSQEDCGELPHPADFYGRLLRNMCSGALRWGWRAGRNGAGELYPTI